MKSKSSSRDVKKRVAATARQSAKTKRAYRRMGGKPKAGPAAKSAVVTLNEALTPVPSKAKPKLELKDRKDLDVTALGRRVRKAMDGNPRFPVEERVPSDEEYDASLTDYEAVLVELENLRLQAMALTKVRDARREHFERSLTRRAIYVQVASKGDSSWIRSAGIEVQKSAEPVGTLPAPLNLRVMRTNLDGEFFLRWNVVKHAESYMVERAEVVDGVIGEYVLVHMGGRASKLLKDHESGKTYAFRVAAVGVANGRSAFSPPVQRRAA